MRLETTALELENSSGVSQLQSQLEASTLKLEKLAKGKEKIQEVWCTRCGSEGHHQNECLMMKGYTVIGDSNLFPQNHVQWCEMCQRWGHVT